VFASGSIVCEIHVGFAVFPSSVEPFPAMWLLLKGEMLTIPDKRGTVMQTLKHRCSSMNPERGPASDEVLDESHSANVGIIPGADQRPSEIFFGNLIHSESRSACDSELATIFDLLIPLTRTIR
jgi:hypothetical protein